MFLRSVRRGFSIQKGALLLRRLPARAVTNAYQVVEENGGDTALVRLCLYLNFHVATSRKLANNAIARIP